MHPTESPQGRRGVRQPRRSAGHGFDDHRGDGGRPPGRPDRPAKGRRGPEGDIRRDGRPPVGTVKFFNTAKGYGFVSRPDGDDLFVHHSNVEGGGFRALETGQQVEFVVAPGRRGLEAREVKVVV